MTDGINGPQTKRITESEKRPNVSVQPRSGEDVDLVTLIARNMYGFYSIERNFETQPFPYAPTWALNYARLALHTIEDEGLTITDGEEG